MRTFLIVFLLFSAFVSTAQPHWNYDGTDIPFNENELRELKLHGVHILSQQSDGEWPYFVEEWEISPAGNVIAYRMYEHYSDENDPYPILPETVMQAPQDTIYSDMADGTKRAECVNYHFLNTYGIWRRSFYYPEYAKDRPWADYMRYNEMQYAFDTDSNLIYYRSQMDYVRPTTLHALQWLVRFDTLGNITETIQYESGINEWSANWYPQFDTAYYESITYDFDAGEATHTSWRKQTATDYYRMPCDHCVGNREKEHIETLPIPERYVEPIVQPFEYPLSRKGLRKRRKHPPSAVTFSGNSVTIENRTYAITYW